MTYYGIYLSHASIYQSMLCKPVGMYQLKNILRSFLFTLQLLILSAYMNSLKAQTLSALSPDGRFFATMEWEKDSLVEISGYAAYSIPATKQVKSSTYLINIYDLNKQQRMQMIRFTVKNEPQPDTLVLSHNAQNFYFRLKHHYFVFHTHSGKIVDDYYFPDQRTITQLKYQKKIPPEYYQWQKIIAFPYYDNLFVIRQGSEILAIDAQSGEVLDTYTGFSRNVSFNKLEFSTDDNYIIMHDNRNRFYVWKTGQKKILKRLIGDELVLSGDNKKIILNKSVDKNFYVYSFNLPSGILKTRISKNLLLRNYPPPSFSEKTIEYYPEKQEYNLTKLSPTGKYLMMGIVNDRLSDLYMIFDVESNKLVDYFEERRPDKKDAEIDWISDNAIEVNESEKTARIYELPPHGLPIHADFSLPEIPIYIETDESYRKMKSGSIVTSRKDYIVFPFTTNEKNGFIIKQTHSTKQKSLIIEDYQFHSFTAEGKEMVVLSANNIPLKLTISDLFKYKQVPDGYLTRFDNTIKLVTEDWIKKDGNPPEGYTYYRLDSIIPFLSVNDSLSVYLVKKSINFTDSVVTLQVHLLDKMGNYFSGISGDKKYYWCGLFVRRPDGNLEEINDFAVDEYQENTDLSNAISVVMDHSGSIGNDRAYEIQKGANYFINAKSDKDGLALIKYDHFIGIESQLTNNNEELKKRLVFGGIAGYGGATALLDGINTGISLLKNKEGYDRKAVIILTDGYENSSLISQKKLLKRALENNISIYTIGFGDYVSDEYLEALSAYTGGSYYRIYSSRDLRWIFNDIYKKLNNYYAINFKVHTVGKHELILKLCIGNSEPLVATFDNTPLPPIDSIVTDDYWIKVPHVSLVPENFFIEEPDIETLLNEIEPVVIAENSDSLKIVKEFNQLKFPDIRFEFDKTIIVKGTDEGLEDVIHFLKKYPYTLIDIIGHTDSLGTDDYNIDLSIRRAEKIKSILVDHGISAKRILIHGKGERMPRVSNQNPNGRSLNRRVEFRLIVLEESRPKKRKAG